MTDELTRLAHDITGANWQRTLLHAMSDGQRAAYDAASQAAKDEHYAWSIHTEHPERRSIILRTADGWEDAHPGVDTPDGKQYLTIRLDKMNPRNLDDLGTEAKPPPDGWRDDEL